MKYTPEQFGRWTPNDLPTLPTKRTRRPAKPIEAPPRRYALCMGKWAAMALTAEIYGFEFIHPEGNETK